MHSGVTIKHFDQFIRNCCISTLCKYVRRNEVISHFPTIQVIFFFVETMPCDYHVNFSYLFNIDILDTNRYIVSS